VIYFIKRATYLLALFFSFNSISLADEPVKSKPNVSIKGETYKDLISKAQVLLLQKDRAQSINILLMGLQKEDAKSVGFQELSKKLGKVSHMFLSEAAQSTYELAISLDKSNKKLAIDKLNEALTLEPQNLQIIKALILRYLSDYSCSKAQKLMENFSLTYPFDPEIIFFEIHSAVCQKDSSKFEAIKKNLKGFEQIPSEILIITNFRLNPQQSLAIIENHLELDIHYPEILFFKWKMTANLSEDKNSLANEYLKLCKTWKTPYVGTNFPDPWICGNIKEVEESKEKK
jgi:hypothetical protein